VYLAVVRAFGGFLNTIVALNSGQVPDVSGGFNSLGHNLIGITNGSTGFTAPGDQTGSKASPLDPRIAPLSDNGGPTLTMALMPGSPAIDAGATQGAPATDQRGIARPQGTATDIGAYEVQYSIPKFTGARFQSQTAFWLGIAGPPNQACTILISSNLTDWSDLGELTNGPNGLCEFVDSDLGAGGARFYRLRTFAQ
jgi:hypothetical protein